MQLTERTVWRVSSGGVTKFFAGELGARQYADDRYENELDGVPFVEEITLAETLARLNELESLRLHLVTRN